MPEQAYVSNPEVVGIQSRLYSPGYVGPARWVLFEPRSRRAFSALGKDVVPDAVSVLAASSSGAHLVELLTDHPQLTASGLDRLVETRLLLPEADSGVERRSTRSFVAAFHAANVDYPFFDYGSPDVVQDESGLLEHYASLWPAPPALTTRAGGKRYSLPAPDDLREPCPGAALSLDAVAWILRTTLGPIGEIRTRFVTCVRRTTPSGGARHPTELVLILRHALGHVPAGSYTYEVAEHVLVREDDKVHAAYLPVLDEREFGWLVRSRVNRAMWRYRDLRALRPLLIDAGHVAEQVSLLLHRLGLTSEVVSTPGASPHSAWLEEPEIVLIRPVTFDEAFATARVPAASPSRFTEADPGDEASYLANPALVLRWNGTMTANVLWPARQEIPIDHVDFLIINHCLPSNRGDRLTSAAEIVSAVNRATVERIERLRTRGALLPRRLAEHLYAGAKLWVRHEWYLALLATFEALSSGCEQPVVSSVPASIDYVRDLGSLERRRTTRVFAPDTVSGELFHALMSRVFYAGKLDVVTSAAIWNVADLASGLYRATPGGELVRMGSVPEREEVAEQCAGQTAASAGAATIWISRLTNADDPARYLMDLIDLGRIGQRVCLAAADLNLGVFITPAVYDSGTYALLGLANPDRYLTYVFGLGLRA